MERSCLLQDYLMDNLKADSEPVAGFFKARIRILYSRLEYLLEGIIA
jgi:hypothetical protein